MAKITLKGNPIETVGELPEINSQAPDFTLLNTGLSNVSLCDFFGKKVILNIFPSIDTPVCAASVRRFNEEASKLDNVVILCISMDLPFAHQRFCAADGLENVESLSAFRSKDFGKDYGVTIIDGPLSGLLSRAIVVIDETGKVVYTEQIPEIAQEPDYASALSALGK
jgi:thiol peroxidase